MPCLVDIDGNLPLSGENEGRSGWWERQGRDEKEGLGGKEEGEMAVRMWIIINNKNHHHSNKKKLKTELYPLFL